MAASKRSHCKGCGAEIYWAVVMPGAKKMPIDISPVDDGNVVWVDGRHVRVLKHHEIGLEQHRNKRYTAHYVTCPQANEFRKKHTGPAPSLFDEAALDLSDPLQPTKEW